jgi:hypothetical protein
MKRTAENAKTNPSEELLDEFWDLFENEPPAATKWAWRTWRADSGWWPPVSEILKLYRQWHREKREAASAEAKRREKEAIEQSRQEGNLVDFAVIAKEMKERIATMPEPEHIKRQRKFEERMRRSTIPPIAATLATLHLSEEQIRARREKERQECERYRV